MDISKLASDSADGVCRKYYQKYLNNGNVCNPSYVPSGGDVVFFRWNKDDYHVGIVYCADEKNPGYIWTIEGNTSGDDAYDKNFGALKGVKGKSSVVAVKHRNTKNVIGYGINH